jgi:steroid delta-isomerase-like uncharacterized protein
MFEDSKALVRRFLEELDKKNFRIIDELCAPDFTYHTPLSEKPLKLAEYKNVVEKLYRAFPDLHHSIEDVIAEEDRVVMRLIDRGTHKGEFEEISPTGKRVEVPFINICRVVNGKLVETWGQFDRLGLMKQLGAVPEKATMKL